MLIVVARRMSWRRRLRASLCYLAPLCLVFLVSGCNRVAPVVKIGLVGPFEGRHRELGYDVIYSARLAIREVNDSGGVGGYRISLVALDDFGDPQMATEIAASLVADDDIVAVLGHWLPGTTASASPIYDRGKVPFVATDSSDFQIADPAMLPVEFQQKYASVTPFDEVAGPFAGGAYDGMKGIISAMWLAEESEGLVTRESVGRALPGLSYEGITGEFEFRGQ